MKSFIINNIDQNYGQGKYMGNDVIIMKSNNFIDASQFLQSNGTTIKKWKQNKLNEQIIQYYAEQNTMSVDELFHSVTQGNYKGTYIHPEIFPYVLITLCPQVCMEVCQIINKKAYNKIKNNIKPVQQQITKSPQISSESEKTTQVSQLIRQNEQSKQVQELQQRTNDLSQENKLLQQQQFLKQQNEHTQQLQQFQQTIDELSNENKLLQKTIQNNRQMYEKLQSQIDENLSQQVELKYQKQIQELPILLLEKQYQKDMLKQQQLVESLQAQIQNNKNICATSKGQKGEDLLIETLKQDFPTACISNTSKISQSCDIEFEYNDMTFIVESKYKTSISTDDVNKFIRDVKKNKDRIIGGVFVSILSTNIPKKGSIKVDYLYQDDMFVMYLGFSKEEEAQKNLKHYMQFFITMCIAKKQSQSSIDVQELIGFIQEQIIPLQTMKQKLEKNKKQQLEYFDSQYQMINTLLDKTSQIIGKCSSQK